MTEETETLDTLDTRVDNYALEQEYDGNDTVQEGPFDPEELELTKPIVIGKQTFRMTTHGDRPSAPLWISAE